MINFCIIHSWNKQDKQDKQDKTEPAHEPRKEKPAIADKPVKASKQADVENL
jgi:hypothetical protein